MKLPVKLAGLEAYQDIKYYLLKVVHESIIVEEFEESWNHTITSHHLKKNEWLANLYEERKRWISALLNSNFFAGMSSTQRSESMNAFFDDYLHNSTTLKVFVEQFENLMRNKVEKEILSILSVSKASWSVHHHLLWRNSSKRLTPMRFLSGCK